MDRPAPVGGSGAPRRGLALTVLGCSGTYAAPGNASSGYLVQSATTTVWIDCGPGTLANVQNHVRLDAIDALVLSHSHPDHWLELPVLRNAWKYIYGVGGVPVFGTAETRHLAEVLTGDDLLPTFDWTVISDGARFVVNDLEFTCSRTDHSVETMALRIDHGGVTVAYSADTGPAWSLDALAAAGPIDLLLCEATIDPDPDGPALHLDATQAGALAAAGGARRLVLTHLLPGSDPDARRRDAEAAFGSPVEIATVGARYEIQPA